MIKRCHYKSSFKSNQQSITTYDLDSVPVVLNLFWPMAPAAIPSAPVAPCPSIKKNNVIIMIIILIYIAPACRMTSEALADSSSRATKCRFKCLTEK